MQEVSPFTDKMGWGIVFYICVIALFIVLKNIRKMNGSTSKKLIYLILVAVVSVVAVFSYATKFRIEVMIEYPLAFISILMILIHLIVKKYAFHWIEFGVSPFSKKYPIEKFSWSGTEQYVKVRYIGIGLCVLSFFQAREVLFFYYMFIIGLIVLILSYSMKKKEYLIVVGATTLISSILFSDIFTKTFHYTIFYIGFFLLIWGFIRLRQAKKLASRELHSANMDTRATLEEIKPIPEKPHIKQSGSEFRCSECGGMVKVDSKKCWKCKTEFHNDSHKTETPIENNIETPPQISIDKQPELELGNLLISYGTGKKINIYDNGYEFFSGIESRHLWSEIAAVTYLWSRTSFNFTLFTGRFYLRFIFKDGNYAKIGFRQGSIFTDAFSKNKIQELLTAIQLITEKHRIGFAED